MIARRGVWLLLAGLLALGANQTLAGAPDSGAALFQQHQAAGIAHNGWLVRHSGSLDQAPHDQPGDSQTGSMLCLLACMALAAQMDFLTVDLGSPSIFRADPVRLGAPLGRTQIRPRPHPGPPRHALPV